MKNSDKQFLAFTEGFRYGLIHVSESLTELFKTGKFSDFELIQSAIHYSQLIQDEDSADEDSYLYAMSEEYYEAVLHKFLDPEDIH